jgi:hypothetical protein
MPVRNPPFFGVPEGDCRTEDPDGVQWADSNSHNLYDTSDKRPSIQSGDQQVYPPPHRARDRKPTV